MNDDVVIVGGGVVGLMNAYFLNKAGKKVTVIDQGDLVNMTSASFGNAGLISSFEKTPLACPGVISNTLKLMLQGRSPVKFDLSLNPTIIKWLLNFIKATNKERLKKTLILFEKYGYISIKHYEEISSYMNIDFHQDGLLMVYSEQKSFDNKVKEAIDSEKYKVLDLSETKIYLPFINNKIIGSVLLKRNGWLDPGKMVHNLYKYLEDNGVNFITNERITKINHKSNEILSVESRKNKYFAENFILATGADLFLQKEIGRKFIMLPAKGYSITFKMDEELKPKIASLFSDVFIAFTPRKDDVRLTSIMEINNNSLSFIEKAMETVLKRFTEFSVNFEMNDIKRWTGLRPLTPNDMPLIGRDENYRNLIHSTGLGWMGITFGPAVGEIISDLIINNKSNSESDDVLLLSGFYQGCC